MIIRTFKKEDAPIILGWIKNKTDLRKWSADRYRDYPATPGEMAQLYAPDNMTPLTAEDENGNVIAHIAIRIPDIANPKAVKLGFIIVDDSLRGKGYGKELIRQTIDYARKNLNATSISLGVFKNNPPALHCYESIGFKENRA
jgi:RimJ/RimL family protein N-acetyltransferase